MKKLLFLLLLSSFAVKVNAQVTIQRAGGSFTGGSITTPILAADGCTTPPYSFTSESTTGFCLSAAATPSIYVGGTQAITFGASYITIGAPGSASSVGDIRIANGGIIAFKDTGNNARVLIGGSNDNPSFGDVNLANTIKGTNFSISTAGLMAISTAIPATAGGTGFASYAIGDLLFASTGTALSKLADVAAGAYLRSGGVTTAPVWSTLILPNAATTGTSLYATSSNTLVAVAPALTVATPADQTGNATATFKMNGLGAAASACTITPVATGRVVFELTGTVAQNTTADGVTWKIAYGTGVAPANAAAATGTVIGATNTWTALTGMLQVPFSATASVTGLALSTAVWYDLQIADVTGGTASAKNVTCTAYEK